MKTEVSVAASGAGTNSLAITDELRDSDADGMRKVEDIGELYDIELVESNILGYGNFGRVMKCTKQLQSK